MSLTSRLGLLILLALAGLGTATVAMFRAGRESNAAREAAARTQSDALARALLAKRNGLGPDVAAAIARGEPAPPELRAFAAALLSPLLDVSAGYCLRDGTLDSAACSSAQMLDVWKAIGRAAASQVPVLITGESGVGKELVARAIHEHGLQRQGPFVAINLVAALPPSLFESEVFGHERGAFTGASSRREGPFELAGNGTLLLDEIGDLEQSLQTKLLRVLGEGRFERVGGTASIAPRARIISATSKLVTPRSAGTALREDLYYRLGVVRIEVPPLRERRQDIPLLVDAFLSTAARAHGRRAVSEAAMRRLVAHGWEGNVRELRHTLESACVMSGAEVLDVADLALPVHPSDSEPDFLAEDDLHLATHVARTERKLISRPLEMAQGSRAQAARLLGIRRALLYARMKELGLSQPGEREG